jgi:hypothetical protein
MLKSDLMASDLKVNVTERDSVALSTYPSSNVEC